MTWDWRALLVFLATLFVLTAVGRMVAFQIPALRRMRELNRETDRKKLARKRFREAVRSNGRVGMIASLGFYVTILPLCIDLEPRPLWRHLFDVVAVLLVFDFFYYLTHRFVFHGKLMRRQHARHHEARTPTYVDALYVHPLETVIGLLLFQGSIPLIAALGGAPLHAVPVAVATLVFTQLNTINHTFVHLPRFPFRTLDRITSLHAAHHVDMNHGNYATLTMLYDWLFGTLEAPVDRPAP